MEFAIGWGIHSFVSGLQIKIENSIQKQTAIYDKQFLRAMIPHHSSAILMCQQAKLTDAEIQELCRSIIDSQQEEIDQMKDIMERLDQ